jgi:Ca2+-transporting ATPase
LGASFLKARKLRSKARAPVRSGAIGVLVTRTAWHTLTADAVLAAQEVTADGLSAAEASARLVRWGQNRLAPPRPASAWRILLEQLSSVVVLLLLAGALLAAAMGDRLDAAAIGAVLVINAGLGLAIDLRARRAMEALARQDARWCMTWRDGSPREVAHEDLVPGDLVELALGKMVPADVRLVRLHELRVDEAVLTGESVPVPKDTAALVDADLPLADRRNMAYKGTVVLAGTALAVVVATGERTEVGRIGALLVSMPDERTPLERRLDVLGRRLVWVTVVVSAAVASLGTLQGLPLARVVETAIALAVAAVPEGLPAVVTITLAIGLRRMAARHALIRRLPAVEALGSVTVVCTDKTRTLTSGNMSVVRIYTAGRDVSLEAGAPADADAGAALDVALRAGQLHDRPEGALPIDPVDAAIARAANHATRPRSTAAAPPLAVVPFSSSRRYTAVISREAGRTVAFLKGAPLRVLALCTYELTDRGRQPLPLEGKRRLLAINRALAGDGLHVLALASGDVIEASETALRGLTFVGFAGLLDPPADGVVETIATLRDAGLRTIMLTGDQRATALAVGRRIGLASDSSAVLDGRHVESLSEPELIDAVAHTQIFSRVTPLTKLAVVRALQARGEIVAMLGDGVNDAAALKKADVGVTMGRRGSDVARDAASIVLEDDRFETIVAAVEQGRVIYDNIRKFVFYLFSCNLAEILVVLLLGLLGLPPLAPLQILWLNLVTDTAPALALALEPADSDVMRRPPRPPDDAMISTRFVRTTVGYSLLLAAVTIGAVLALDDPSGARATTVAFMTLAVAEVLHLGNARGRESVVGLTRALANPYALGAVFVTIAAQYAVGAWPASRSLLELTPLTPRDWLVVAIAASLPATAGQIGKLVRDGHVWPPAPAVAGRA